MSWHPPSRPWHLIAFAFVSVCVAISHAQLPVKNWAKVLGGPGPSNRDWANKSVVDPSGNSYTVGRFEGTVDFDTGPGNTSLTSAGSADAFILKLDINGTLVWVRRMGGLSYEEALGVTLDGSGNVYVVGTYKSFTGDYGPFTLTRPGSLWLDAFVVRVQSDGTFDWAKALVGSDVGDTRATSVGISNASVVVGGNFTGTVDFDPGAGIVNRTSVSALSDAFLLRLSLAGNYSDVATFGSVSGLSGAGASELTVDDDGTIYTVGAFSGTIDFDPGGGTANFTGSSSSSFILRLSPTFSYLGAYAFGSPGFVALQNIGVDAANNMCTFGTFSGTADFDPGTGTLNATAIGNDIVALKLDATGAPIWLRQVGATGDDWARDVVLDAAGNFYMTGYSSNNPDFDPGPGVFRVGTTPSDQAFVFKLTAAGNFAWAAKLGMNPPEGITLAPQDQVVLTGALAFSGDFDPGTSILTMTSAGEFDASIQKLQYSAVITDFNPKLGPIGTTVTIDGLNFDPTPANNIVRFGAVQASVTAATPTQLTVTVPVGATFDPISVKVNGLTVYSDVPFLVTFPDGGTLDACALAAPVEFSGFSGPIAAALFDIDGDGKLDLVSANSTTISATVRRNISTTGDITSGSFAAGNNFTIGVGGSNPRALAVGDIDGDGKPDLVVTRTNAARISVLRNTSTPGSISFAARIEFTTGANPYSIAIADIDGDGKPEVAVVNQTAAMGLSIFHNLSTPGTITTGSLAAKVDFATGTGPTSVVIADLDGDDKKDIVVSNEASNTLSLHRNLSQPWFFTTASLAAKVDLITGALPKVVSSGDLDNDGRVDLAVANFTDNTFSVFKNNSNPGSFSFDPKVDRATNNGPYGLTINDLDGDAKPDVIITNQGAPVGLHVFKNTSSATIAFGLNQAFAATVAPWNLAVGDIDGDGKPEVTAALFSMSRIAVFRNTVSSLPPPTIFTLDPSFGTVGTSVTINGLNFSTTPANNIVRFNGTLASVSASTSNTITTTVPASATTGIVTVQVGCNTVSSGSDFTVILPVPTITAFTPVSGPVGTSVTITGLNFSSTPANNIVYFGSTQAAVVASTPTQLTVLVPPGATYQPITVTRNGSTGFSQSPFLVTFPNGGVINTCSFAAPNYYSTGTIPSGMGLALGDLDGDGKTDLVVSNPGIHVIQVFRNTSSIGTINASSLAASIDLPVGTNPLGVTISDIDGDGKLDIVATSRDVNELSIYRNVSTPGTLTAASFSAPVVLATPNFPNRVVCQDMDGDGRTDIVSGGEVNALSIWRNIGTAGTITTGSFSARVDLAVPSYGLAIADIDQDGKPDLLQGNSLGNTVGILRNISTAGTLTTGSFEAAIPFTVGNGVDYIAVGDLDADTRPDVVTTSWSDGSFSILKNASTPGTILFGSQVVFTGHTDPRGVTITDFDGSGKPDIGIVNEAAGTVSMYRNISTGTITTGSFDPRVDFFVGGNSRNILGGDIDNDGKPDIVVSDWSGPPLSIARNTILSLPAPSITGFSPPSGPPGTPVTIDGTNFSTSVSENFVRFNGTLAIVTGATATSLNVLVPGGGTTGNITIDVGCNGTGTSGTSFTVTPLVFSTCTAISLNGATDYIEVANNPSLEPSSITVEALVNFSVTPTINAIVAMPDGTTFGDSFAIWYEAGNLRAGVRLGPSVFFPWTPNVGQWYHVALTYNSAMNSEILYLNGAPVAAGTSLNIIYGNEPLLIGSDINFGVHDLLFNGKIDEVRFWNVARTGQEILTNLTGSLSGNEPGLVAYYIFNETGQGTGITVANNATATGVVNNGLTVGTATTPVFQATCSCVPINERNALIALYNATDGPNWVDDSGWLTDPDEDNWNGVLVSGCHVVGIDLANNGLLGPLPPELGDLIDLTELELFNNQLYGVIPPEIGNLTELTRLSLSLNQFYGEIPVEIGNLTNLEFLHLGLNQFYGLIPDEVWTLTSLKQLHLFSNQFEGVLPPEIGDLTNLTSLRLGANYFYGAIPPEIGNLTTLTVLQLGYNYFDGTIPIEIGNLVNLTELLLNNNSLFGAIPIEIGNAPNNLNLALDHNFFTDLPDLTTTSLNTTFADITVNDNMLTFEDLEPNVGFNLITLGPQAKLPPGGTQGFTPGGPLFIPFATPGSNNSYQWYKDGSPVPGQTAASLNIASTTAANVGFYYLLVTSSIVPGVTLESLPYTVYTDLCTPGPRTAGDLDTSFDPPTDFSSSFYNLAVQSTGKVLVSTGFAVVNSTNMSGLLRFNSDGSFDNTFTPHSSVQPFVVQPNDRIIISINTGDLERLAADGEPDGSFISPDYYNAYISAMALQSDGKVIVAVNEDGTPYIDRRNQDGTDDPLFSGPAYGDVTVIKVQTDGKILIGGQFSGGIARLESDGSIDGSFIGVSGDFVFDIALQADGKILVVGMFSYFNDLPHRGVVRLHPDGSIDDTFDAVGITDNIESGFFPNKIAIQTDGKIILGGLFETINGTSRRNLIRLNDDGTVDCAFDPEESTESTSDVESARITEMVLQANGQILISGAFEEYDNVQRFGLARVNGGSITGCLPATERNALIALYNSTNGAGWVQNSNWLSVDESTWFGVSVTGCRVTHLNLPDNKLTGTLPTELGDLTQLITLNLGQTSFPGPDENTISGSIPTSYANLTTLEFLALSVHQLSGPLPAFIGGLGSLKTLDLGDNQFTGNIPTSWFSLPLLESLTLSDNALNGSLSTQIGQLTTLVSLVLGDNQFSGTLPVELGNLTALTTLILDGNQFTGSLPSSIGNLTNLFQFGCSVNQLSGNLPASLGNLTGLYTLALSLNQFTGDVPPAIGTLPNLSYVNIRGNQFTSIPTFVSTGLNDFRVFDNRLHFGHLEPNVGRPGFVYSPQANLPGGTASACTGGTLTIAFLTPGTANQYQWYKDGVLIPGATSSTFSKTNAAAGDAGNYSVQITNTIVTGLTLQSDDFVVNINTSPSAPGVVPASACILTPVPLGATGASNGQYRWYTALTGGVSITGEVNDVYNTPGLTTSTTYYVAINNGTCESTRTPVLATVLTLPAPPAVVGSLGCAPSASLTLNASGASPGEYRWYTVPSGGSPLVGETNSSYVTPGLTSTTTYYVSVNNGSCESARIAVVATIQSCTPTIATSPLATQIGGQVSLDLGPLITTIVNALDLNSIQVTVQPISGALATVTNGMLVVDYTGIAFAGTDRLTIRACDVAGHCAEREFIVEVAGEITIYNALSPNGDGKNETFIIQYIEALPETQKNKLTIFNRWGTVVYEATDYNNSSNVFKGLSNSGDELPSGTYYYTIEFESGAAKRTGFISLRR